MTTKNHLTWLPTTRSCACPEGSINCLSERQWLRNQVPIWFFNDRELNTKFDNFSRQNHPAIFPSALAKRVIRNYTHENETVLDIFSGVGTVLYAAQALKRNSIGVELNTKFTDFTNRRLKLTQDPHYSTPENTHRTTNNGQVIQQLNMDNRKILDYIPDNSIDLVFTSPPYWDLLSQPPSKRNIKSKKYLKNNYSDDPADLSNDRTLEEFIKNLTHIFSNLNRVIKPGSRCVVNTVDYRRQGKFIPLSNIYIQILRELDFELKNIIIWDRRREYDIGIFSYPRNFIVNNGMFEYLLEFIK
jgi:DNA modification methylase